MTERPKGGPIRRKAGSRRKEREARRGERTASVPEKTAPEAESEASEKPMDSTKPPEPPKARVWGRRVFEPPGRRDTSSAKERPAPRPARTKVPESSPASAEVRKPSPEAVAKQQETAKKLAVDKGIPQVHALRVVRGEVSLNVVLKNLMRKERATRLIEQDGLEPGLAGQVASGHLSRQRALELQKIRLFRKHRIDRDALKLAEIDCSPVGVGCFDGSWTLGTVVEARTYEFDIVIEDGETRLIQKHDVKLVCAAEAVEALREGEIVDEAIRDAGLRGTADRGERVRPQDARLLALIDSDEEIDLVLRDGSQYRGRVRSFGRWDMSIEVEGAGQVTVLFHALHKSNTWVA